MKHQNLLASTCGLLLAALSLSGCGSSTEAANEQGTHSPSATSTLATEASPAPTASASAPASPAADIDSAASLTVLVNKARPLEPLDYTPENLTQVGSVQLRAEAAEAAKEMFAAAASDGVNMTAISGFRSYDTQVDTYNSWVATYGQQQADVASARPGFSEHQTGLAMDIGTGGGCDVQVCFKDTDAAVWAAEHAPEYGFVLRYPWGFHDTTGYWYESWHFRYIGKEEAAAYRDSGATTLEDFWGTGPAPSYPEQ